MSLVNNSANNFKDFLDAIKPFLNYQFYDMSGQGVEAMNFSTDEKVIGTWIDGKPLYQKTVDCGDLPNAATKTVAHGVSNIDRLIHIEGNTMYDKSGDKSITPSYYVADGNANYSISSKIIENNIFIRTYSDMSPYSNLYVTIRYTKTTDTAVASGEKIVGQWIDGKPLYQKTIELENITLTGTNQSNVGDLSALNFDYIVVKNVNAVEKFYDSGSSYNETFSYTFGYLSCWVRNMASAINFGIKQTFDSRTATYDKIYITIQYTKTS